MFAKYLLAGILMLSGCAAVTEIVSEAVDPGGYMKKCLEKVEGHEFACSEVIRRTQYGYVSPPATTAGTTTSSGDESCARPPEHTCSSGNNPCLQANGVTYMYHRSQTSPGMYSKYCLALCTYPGCHSTVARYFDDVLPENRSPN